MNAKIASIPVGAGLAGDGLHSSPNGQGYALLRRQGRLPQRTSYILNLCSLALAISLAGCAGLPDQRLANEALKRGDTALAEQNYRQLADLGYSEAQVGLADIQVETRDPAKLKEAEATYRAAEQPRAELLLGRLYYEGKTVPADAQKAETHLLGAANAGEVSAHYYLGQLYRRGYLGKVDPQKAVDHLLSAARGGQLSADYALAQLFSEGHGIRQDLVNAWVFSQLAQANPSDQSREMASQLDQQLTPAQKSQAERLLQQERQARGAIGQGPGVLALQAELAPEQGEDSL